MKRAIVAAAAVAALAVTTTGPASALDNGVGRTPPMGWNSWNTFDCHVDETLVKQVADAMASNGMRAAGYGYVVIDDCWFDPQRTRTGELRANPARFPHGMKALADYIHGKGLKLGLYEVPTAYTCAQRGGVYPGRTGSLGHERQDARTFASWGVDYLKYDWCDPKGSLQDKIRLFSRMRDALASTGRAIYYSINPNSYSPVKSGATYDWSAIANMTRTTEDIKPVWETGHTNDYPMGVVDILDVQARPALAARPHPGYWNDPDMLEVGVYHTDEGYTGLTDVEARSHFGMWALMAAPLIAGNDPRRMPRQVQAILTNREVIAVDQDPRGVQGKRVVKHGDQEVWAKPLADSSVAVGLLNRGPRAVTIATDAAAVALPSAAGYTLRDLFRHTTRMSAGRVSSVVPAHGLVLYRITPRS